MNKKIWLSSPHMGGKEMKYIQKAFDENWVAPLGPNVNGLEEDIERFLGEDIHVAAVSSGSAALHLALILLGVEAGDEVLCQSLTFSASANPIMYLGAQPVFVDSEIETWNMCPAALEDAIKERISLGKKPKAVILVHLYGMPAKINEILDVAAKYGIPVVEDAAEALGSSFKGQLCGTFGRYGVLSFNGNKIITTSGGGALVCPDEESKKRAVFFATQARDDAPYYQHSHVGYNYRMSNISAGIGRGQMEVLSERIEARRKMHAFYTDIFSGIEGVEVLTEPNHDFYSNHWLSAITVNPEITGKTSEDLRLSLLDDNIEARPLWKPMHLQPVFKNSLYFGSDLAEKCFETGLCLPSGSNLTENDFARISHLFAEIFSLS